MKIKIGNTETALATALYCSPPFFLVLCSGICSKLGAGAWINFLVFSALVSILAFFAGKYFKRFDTGIISACNFVCGKFFMWIIGLLYLIFNLIYTGQSFILFTKSISALGFGAYSYEYISFIPVIASAVCAYAGAEGNTRTLYAAFFVVLAFVGISCYSTFKAWDKENLFPLFGNELKGTFFDYKSVCAYAGIHVLFLLNGAINRNSGRCSCLLRAFSVVFLCGFSMILVYLLSVPYPLNKLYEFSPVGLFSATMSGDLFHRFEFLLVSLCIVLDICTTSFGLLICSSIVCELTSFNDTRPFILIFSVMIFYLKSIDISGGIYTTLAVIMTVVTLIIPITLVCIDKIKHHNTISEVE